MIKRREVRTTKNREVRLLAAAIAAASLAGPAFGHQLAPTQQTCTTLNCNALDLPGVINGHPPSPPIANEWGVQILGAANSCMRFHVTSENRDLAMSVIGPDGRVFSNNNSGVAGCPQCPLVVVGSARKGFYSVVIGAADGLATEAKFTLRAAIYSAGNSPNCNGPTPPR